MKPSNPVPPTISMGEPLTGVIIKGVGGAYTVSTPQGIYICSARGVFRNQQVSPVIGDYVRIALTDAPLSTGPSGTLQEILPRRNELFRPRIANVDQVIITMAAVSPDFNADLLDRYLLLIENAGVPAVICINKYDLCGGDFDEASTRPYVQAGYWVVLVSTVTGEGLQTLHARMPDRLSVFAGPSGVGKSSLINALVPGAACETGVLSVKIARGKNTTRHTEILPVQPSGFCADSPGFTSLDIGGITAAQLPFLFKEFVPFLGLCRFTDCRHESESGCAVKDQVGKAIHPRRYESYIRILRRPS